MNSRLNSGRRSVIHAFPPRYSHVAAPKRAVIMQMEWNRRLDRRVVVAADSNLEALPAISPTSETG
jgi:hypothetical protein